MIQADYFNEAIVTAMLAAQADGQTTGTKAFGPPGAAAASAMQNPDGLAESPDLGLAPALLERLTRLLNAACKRADADGVDRQIVEAADFAVCAFVDETLLSSQWSGREEWMRSPLQLVRHDTATAGEDFYRILDSLLQKAEELMPFGMTTPGNQDKPVPPDANDAQRQSLKSVLEVFALCLARGFTGMLFDDEAAIRAKLLKIGNFVPAVMRGLTIADGAPLFPEAYPETPSRKAPLNLMRRYDALDWLLWLAPLLATGILYFVYDTRLNTLLDALKTLAEGSIPP
ncbi:MAG: DotU family type IV/VI secretion system protein [Desulfovibrio sp.]|jgi:type VI secretion system protein ImpK|nr:DotU family type IV/VI secretion system protein [Desulfovibrio sp.]